MKKRVSSLVLALIVTAAALASCGSSESSSSAEVTTTASSESVTAAASESESVTDTSNEIVTESASESETATDTTTPKETTTTKKSTTAQTATTASAATKATTQSTASTTTTATKATAAKAATTTRRTTKATTTTAGTSKPAQQVSVPSGTLSNPKANSDAKALYKYICDNYGKVMLTCQQESTWMGSPDYEMDYISETTGKLPAIRGLDFMNNDFSGVVKRAKEWHNKGGIVTICWHTGVNGSGYQESLNDNPDFNKLLTPGTEEYKAMISSWDKAAAALSQLQDAGVAVLWRPFHEFDGKWFWWGKGGSDNFIKLWQMMYDYYTNEKGLNNLIWVLGYSGEVRSGWYPGDNYCDIIGSDTYDNSTNKKAWSKLERLGTGKPMAFHECGNVPSVSKFESDGDLWSWFMIWHTDYITNNPKENLKSVYNSDKVITLDELPKL